MTHQPRAPAQDINAVRVHAEDNVIVALRTIEQGEPIIFPGGEIAAKEAIPAGHKVASFVISEGSDIVKYGGSIGQAIADIALGGHVHTHNVSTQLSGRSDYRYTPENRPDPIVSSAINHQFDGYRRSGGRVGTRNEIWVVTTVGCVNRTVERIVVEANTRFGQWVDGIHAFTHPFGCSQLGDDLANTKKILAGLVNHPNAGGVLVVGLGCESNQMAGLLPLANQREESRLRFFNAQAVADETEIGLEAIADLVETVRHDRRAVCPIADLVVGLKCGGSDGFSGLSANPLVGDICDQIMNAGGRAILTEIPEMFGAEEPLMNRAETADVFDNFATVVNDFKQYFIDHGQPVYENPSPGNIEGGITTLEEKSLGAVQKGGMATITDVIRYGESVRKSGLTVLEAPGNDAVSSTALVAAGATVLLFTTGRGTPLGFPVPTIKVASNSDLASRKPHWIDFDAGPILDGQNKQATANALLGRVTEIASGAKAQNEKNGEREIAIWKSGVTL